MSDLEDELELTMRQVGIHDFVREHRFNPPRRHRFDFAWLDRKLAVEVEGGVWTGGRHTTGSGFTKDIDKYNSATLLGWSVLRVTGDMVTSGAALKMIEDALKGDAA